MNHKSVCKTMMDTKSTKETKKKITLKDFSKISNDH